MLKMQSSRGLADLLRVVLLAYRVHVPDNASKVSTPKEHRICTLDTTQLDSRAVCSNSWKQMPLMSRRFGPYRYNNKSPGLDPETDHQGGTDLQRLVKWLDHL